VFLAVCISETLEFPQTSRVPTFIVEIGRSDDLCPVLSAVPVTTPAEPDIPVNCLGRPCLPSCYEMKCRHFVGRLIGDWLRSELRGSVDESHLDRTLPVHGF
jgi:hypothetical protein